MSKTDYRKLMNKEYLGAWDVPEGSDLVLTISKALNSTYSTNSRVLIYSCIICIANI